MLATWLWKYCAFVRILEGGYSNSKELCLFGVMTETIPLVHRNISRPSIVRINTIEICIQDAEKLSKGSEEAFQEKGKRQQSA